jgi:iron complex outermembrane receptor protein
MDTSFSHAFNDHVSVFLDAVNVPAPSARKTRHHRVSTVETFGRRFYFGVRGKM